MLVLRVTQTGRHELCRSFAADRSRRSIGNIRRIRMSDDKPHPCHCSRSCGRQGRFLDCRALFDRRGQRTADTVTSSSHNGEGFTETPVRFGTNNRLVGILCTPRVAVAGKVAALLLSSGYDPMSGWARSSVRLARSLAAQGISSLRFDGANVADSPPMMGTSQQVLYDISQIIDVETLLRC